MRPQAFVDGLWPHSGVSDPGRRVRHRARGTCRSWSRLSRARTEACLQGCVRRMENSVPLAYLPAPCSRTSSVSLQGQDWTQSLGLAVKWFQLQR